LYTDYFLAETIEWLKTNTPAYETSLLYVSDHGESLGENGMYLHGMPYMIAPAAQTGAAMLVWAGESSDIDFEKSRAVRDEANSHDALSQSLLELFEVNTDVDLESVVPLFYLRDNDSN
jgi:lipid A ethanolaminephosphotransferase